MLSDLLLRVRAVFRRSRVEAEIDDELRHHLERQIDTYVGTGLDRNEATRRANAEFGGLDQIKEEYRDALGVGWIDDFRRDARHSFRSFLRSPLLAVTAIVSVALGVGANALVFSVVNAVVLKPLPIRDPDRVVFVQRVGDHVSHSFPAYRDLRDRNTTFAGLAGYRITMMDVDVNNMASHEWGYLATGNYFDLLGVAPLAGRFFDASDDGAAGASPHAVLSFEYWQTRFAGDPAVIGSTVRINRLPFTVIGVAPRLFYGTEIFYRPSLWVPMTMQAEIEVGNPWLENRNTANTWVIGRLRPGATVAQAEANLGGILKQLDHEYATAGNGGTIRLTRPGLMGDLLGGPARSFVLGVLALAGLVLLAACANLASALSARGADRQRELAVRLSIGAGRGRIVRQLLTETLLLACIGGALGAIGAAGIATVLSGWQLPVTVPIQLDLHPDARVFIFSMTVSLIAGIAFGLAPARQAATTNPNTTLKAIDGPRAHRQPIRDILVALQVALCFVLVAACLLSIQGLRSALSMRLGLDPHGITMAGFDLGLAGYSEEQGAPLREQALETVRALPGVQSAAYASSLPLNIDQSSTVIYPDDRPSLLASEAPVAVKYQVSTAFFQTLGIRRLQGRDFDGRDVKTATRVAIVNEAFARRVFRSSDAVGRHFGYGPNAQAIEVVGVVETGKYQSLTEPETPAVFEPAMQRYNSTTVMLARSTALSGEVATNLRRVMRTLDPAVPLFGVRSVEEMLGYVLLPMRVAAVALGAFGLLALMLAATGIHGVVAYAVAQRRREIAIRVALGATRPAILKLVFGRIGALLLSGLALGVCLTAATRGVLRSIVYQQSANDLTAVLSVALIIGVVGLLACWRPARRALRLQPAEVLYLE